MRRNRVIKTIAIVLLLSSVILFSAFKTLTLDELFQKFDPVFEVLTYINRSYYDIDEVDTDKLLDETLKGLMKGLNDPYAWYFDKIQSREIDLDTESKYGGIGATVQYNVEHDCLLIVAPMAGSPAEEVGLLSGDLIVEIDGHLVSETGYYESVELLRGVPDTDVEVKVMREGEEDYLYFTITRREIEIKTVKYGDFSHEDKQIGYIQITTFSRPTHEEFLEALTVLPDVDAYIIDLRNNTGGLLTSALNISNMLVPRGQIVVTIRDRDGREDVYRSRGSLMASWLEDKPIVLLVNEGSASASEIIAGALKDNNIAKIVGEKTFGKATVQSVYELSNDGEIWLPTARYFTPSGTDIHLKGITPDITVEATEVAVAESREITLAEARIDIEGDLQLRAAIDLILEGF